MKRYEFTQGTSNKFWEIGRKGATLTELVDRNAAARARGAALSSNDTALSSE